MIRLVRNLLVALVAAGALTVVADLAAARSGQEGASASAPKAGDTPVEQTTPAPKPAPPPSPTPTADAEEQLEEFVPTEHLPADQAVAFPVDI